MYCGIGCEASNTAIQLLVAAANGANVSSLYDGKRQKENPT